VVLPLWGWGALVPPWLKAHSSLFVQAVPLLSGRF